MRCVRVFGFAVSLLFSASAHADGLKWNGAYIGANVGYGFANIDGGIAVLNPGNVPYATGPLGYGIDTEGVFGGLQAGINRRTGHFLLGLEADVQLSDISGSSRTSFVPPAIFPFTYTASTFNDWFATVRGRVGVATDDTLVYVTGGLAVGNVNYNASYLIPQNNAFANLRSSDTQVGYVLGAGVERALNSNWSLKLEYQFIDFGKQSASGPLRFANGVPSGETVTTQFDTEIHTVRVGLNYHFSTHNGP